MTISPSPSTWAARPSRRSWSTAGDTWWPPSTGPRPRGTGARDAVAEVGRTLLAQRPDAPVVGAGVVVPGLVDRGAGVAAYSANIGWRDLELVRSLGAEWRLPVRIANDVASGGVAEHRLGAGVGTQDLVFVCIGTGIAASIVSGGHLVTGHRGETAEIGHLAVRSGIPCACGRDGCLEAIASAAAIARRYSELSGHDVSGAHEVAARRGTDGDARQVWQEAVEALADALGMVSLLVGPALVVIGGGLSRAGDGPGRPTTARAAGADPRRAPGRGDRLDPRRPRGRDRRRPPGARRLGPGVMTARRWPGGS